MLLHLASTEHWSEFCTAIERIPQPFDLIINLVARPNDKETLRQQQTLIQSYHPDANIIISDNRGMDIGGMFRLFQKIKSTNYQVVFYGHSKSDSIWRQTMLDRLTINCSSVIEKIVQNKTDKKQIGMCGAYFYPFDYYNLNPFLNLINRLRLDVTTDWSNYFNRFPYTQAMSIEQRLSHALDSGRHDLRPEVDIDYFQTFIGEVNDSKQLMNASNLKQMIASKTISKLPYYPGNFFWISMDVIKRLSKVIDFEQEYLLLPKNLKSDETIQSLAHAWERMLPVFANKSGFELMAINPSN